MKIVRILSAVVFPIALLGCPDNKGDAKGGPAASASAAVKTTTPAAASASAAPAASGGSGW